MKRRKQFPGSELTLQQRHALLHVKIRKDVEEYGCFVMCVGGGPGPHFAYSIGIPTTFPGASEIILFALGFETMAHLINDVVRQMREGQPFEAGQQYDGILQNFPVYFGWVKPEHYDSHVGQGQVYHGSDTGFGLLQMVWPDTKGKFPWQSGFEERFREAQPLLFDVPVE